MSLLLPCRRLALLSLLILSSLPCFVSAQIIYHESTLPVGSAQVGLSVNYFVPHNAFGKDFARAPCYELYYQSRDEEGESAWTSRLGFFYIKTRPRLDTIPVYMIQSANPGDKVLPGSLCYEPLTLKGLFAEFEYSLFQIDRFRLNLGAGIMIGTYHMKYVEDYATVIHTTADNEDWCGGLRLTASASFRLNKYFELYASYKNAALTTTDWSTNFSHTLYGAGLNFTFRPE